MRRGQFALGFTSVAKADLLEKWSGLGLYMEWAPLSSQRDP